jgi:Tfp pilus assembly protein PilF
MDCRATPTVRNHQPTRRSSVVTLWVGRLALLFCPLLVLGCVPQTTLPVAPEPKPDEAKLPKITPKPKTCVDAGQMLEASSEDPKKSPEQKAELVSKAKLSYQQALRLDPNFTPAVRSLARLHVKEGRDEEAITTLQDAVKKSPRDASLYFDLAMSQARHKDFEKAVQSMQQAVTLAPDNRAYATTYGHILGRAGRYDEALNLFTRLMGAAPALYQVARMQVHTKQMDLARSNLERALQMEPNMNDAKELLTALNASPVVPVEVKFEE